MVWAALALAGAGSQAGAQDLQACGGAPGAPGWVSSGVYRGTLGREPIALQTSAKTFENRYYYERHATDIALTPFRAGETLILQEEVRLERAGDQVVTGCFTLKRTAAGLSGTWHAPGRQGTLPVQLGTLNASKLPLNLMASPGLQRLRAQDPLAFLKLNRAWVRTAATVREPLSGLTYPRVPNASAALNAALQDRLLENAVSALECRSLLPQDLQNSADSGYELTAALTLQKPRLVSLREDVYDDCGGAHPDNFTHGVILDRATGRPVTLAALWPGLNAARLTALYLGRVGAAAGPDCMSVLREAALEFTANLTPAGLNLTPTSLPHVVAACGETAVISYATLRPDTGPASAYFRDLYSR